MSIQKDFMKMNDSIIKAVRQMFKETPSVIPVWRNKTTTIFRCEMSIKEVNDDGECDLKLSIQGRIAKVPDITNIKEYSDEGLSYAKSGKYQASGFIVPSSVDDNIFDIICLYQDKAAYFNCIIDIETGDIKYELKECSEEKFETFVRSLLRN